jgi:hypothetical protein
MAFNLFPHACIAVLDVSVICQLRVQVWSMGVVLWQMLTLQPLPYAHEARLMAVLDGVRDGTLDLRPSLPLSTPWALLSALAYRCLDPEPTQRPSCARAMQVLDDHCHYARQMQRGETLPTDRDLSQHLLAM